MMPDNQVIQKIHDGHKAVGAFFHLGSVPAVEILGQLGLDFIIIDSEHAPVDVEIATSLIIAAERRGLTPFVRVKDRVRSSILKMLDIGAMGLLIPMVRTVDEVKELISYAKYWPVGERGYGMGRKACYGLEPVAAGSVEDYFNWNNQNTLLIPQCETVECVENIEDIVALEGVDGIFIGPFDLSIAMGLPRQLTHPDLIAAMERVVKACHAAGKFVFTVGSTPDEFKMRCEQGYDGAIVGDLSFFMSGAMQYLNGLKTLGY